MHSSSVVFVIVAILAGCRPAALPSPARTTSAITAADARSRIYIVADDSMMGRPAGEQGNFMMTNYLAREVARLALEPGGENGSYFQTVPMIRRWADSSSTMTTATTSFALFTDFVPVRPTSTVPFATELKPGRLESIYGGRAGDSSMILPATAVAGKLVVLDAPLGANGQIAATYTTAAAHAISMYPSAAAIAIAVLDIATQPILNSLRGRGVGLSTAGVQHVQRPFGLLISNRAAAEIVGAPLGTPRSGRRGMDVDLSVRFSEAPTAAPARNVIAIIRGADPVLRGQYVAIGAHSDHITRAPRPVDHDSLKIYNRTMRPNGADTRVIRTTGATPAELAQMRISLDSTRKIRPARLDSIFNGADDDGSGSVALLEIAESMASGTPPRRSVIFVWHTGEEAGLLGSAWFTEHTTVHHDSIVAQLNMDMVGRGMRIDHATGGPDNLQVIGSRRLSTDLGNVLDSVNSSRKDRYTIDYSFDAGGHVQNRYCRSDHYMYARSGIPIAYISRGYHPDYHMVTDEAQYISYDGLAKVASFVRDVTLGVANRNDRVRVDKPRPNPLAPCKQ